MECIRLRGARQNNLKGLDLDLPLGRYIVVTGLSGSGKSSLVFDTLHAEGQRRYVETFSAYTRQFLDLLDPPQVDSIENIRPSIAITQTNTIKTSRSTVGTMTELTDFAKIWFSHAAECFDPETGEKVEDDNPQTIWKKIEAGETGRPLVMAFEIRRPANLSWSEIVASLKGQGYTRVVIDSKNGAGAQVAPIDDAALGDSARSVLVVQDRVEIRKENRKRFVEGAEAALHLGNGEVRFFRPIGQVGDLAYNSGDLAYKSDDPARKSHRLEPAGHYSRGLHSPKTGRRFRAAVPALFSFNSPLGACPRCRGFGRIIEIDYRLALPDTSLSIDAGAIRCWEGKVYGSSKEDLRVFAKKRGISTRAPFAELSPEQRAYVIEGEPGYGEENGKTWPKHWYGVKGFFRWLEKNAYKMHVRVFLSRYRAYNLCPDCRGSRLQPEALCWKWRGRTLPELYSLPIDALHELVAESPQAGRTRSSGEKKSAELAREAILARLRYLRAVGLGYLTLDRPSKTLSGGEVERVNLTSCLGTSLVDTLFVLDEPSVGLHPRDVDRLIAIIRSLCRSGNTTVVVEHDEAMIRSAEHVVELGPGPGAAGGKVVFEGSVAELIAARGSATGDCLSGRLEFPAPKSRRPVADARWLELEGVQKHNLRNLSLRFPLGRFVCLSGVSGSGKSTILDNVIHQGLLRIRGRWAEDPAAIGRVRGDGEIGEVVLVDQAPLSRTPRSNPALYTGAWDPIRELYASTPEAQAAGFGASGFSFNAGDGRCDHCRGLGSERVEMQFLSDVFVPCPVCAGRRFKPEILRISWNGRSVADLLGTTAAEAIPLFEGHSEILSRLAALEKIGLGYLTLGQPLNTLSGGESQRLKLVRYLSAYSDGDCGPGRRPGLQAVGQVATVGQVGDLAYKNKGALLLLDEPTTGLHRCDVMRLLDGLNTLVDRGHSLVVIEHHLDVLKCADWILEIGPEAGDAGGRVAAEGTPETIARSEVATAPFLRAALEGGRSRSRERSEGPELSRVRLHSETPPSGSIELVGAREHNLKNLSLEIPRRSLNVVTGVSGSGKSTLAFDIIFAEGQRRFLESISSYARQFVEQLPRPDIDRLTGIPPTVAIEQRITRGSRKSVVATVTEVAPYLRLLYARLGIQHHPETGRPVTAPSSSELKRLLREALAEPRAKRTGPLKLCAPIVRGRKGHHQPVADWLERRGLDWMRVDGRLRRVDRFEKLDRYREHDIDAVVGELSRRDPPSKQGELLEEALKIGRGSCFLILPDGKTLSWFSTSRTDRRTGESYPELDPKNFSFNSPRGWCPTCRGYGRILPEIRNDDDEESEVPIEVADLAADSRAAGGDPGALCPDCRGSRLNRISSAVKLPFRSRPSLSLPELLRLPPPDLIRRLRALRLDSRGRLIARDVLPQIEARLAFLERVGLGYLTLDRPADTLSGGEAQRIRLAAQLGSNLSGVLYVLDEPSIGLHARDNEKLIASLLELRAKGNTLLVVEHDEALMRSADRLIDLGPGAGIHGGELLVNAEPREAMANAASITGRLLAAGLAHPLRGSYRELPRAGAEANWIRLRDARYRNLRGFNLDLPLGRLIMVAGPSGAGKSTLFRDLLRPAIARALKAGKSRLTGSEFAAAESRPGDSGEPSGAPFRDLRLGAAFGSVVEVDQAPIGKTPRSTPATYLGIFDSIRRFFASLPESRVRGYTASRFSFNVPGGRCPTCEGAGRVRFEMAFLPDANLPCEDCLGLRYGPELGEIAWRGKSIGEVLRLTFEEAEAFFGFHAPTAETCRLMVECGLGYLTLGQSSPTLSGGEAQRLKLVTELARGGPRAPGTPRNLYVLEEPTIGLHLSDCEKLIRVLHSLVDRGHTAIVIEHHADLIAEADYVVELGPGGGPDGGRLLYQGGLAGLLRSKSSPTAPYVRAKIK